MEHMCRCWLVLGRSAWRDHVPRGGPLRRSAPDRDEWPPHSDERLVRATCRAKVVELDSRRDRQRGRPDDTLRDEHRGRVDPYRAI